MLESKKKRLKSTLCIQHNDAEDGFNLDMQVKLKSTLCIQHNDAGLHQNYLSEIIEIHIMHTA